jgi:hypothetical protein
MEQSRTIFQTNGSVSPLLDSARLQATGAPPPPPTPLFWRQVLELDARRRSSLLPPLSYRNTCLVELPARWDMDDYTAFAYFEDPAVPEWARPPRRLPCRDAQLVGGVPRLSS